MQNEMMGGLNMEVDYDVCMLDSRAVLACEQSDGSLKKWAKDHYILGMDGIRQYAKKSSRVIANLTQVIENMVDVHDPQAAGHQREVALMAKSIAQEMSGDSEFINCVLLAAQIHDIGKIMIPPEILTVPGKLDIMQQAVIKLHPQTGYAMLRPLDFPWDIARIIYQHHERLDGTGYPQGLQGGQIMLESRILAVADVAQAMVSKRSYHLPVSVEQAMEELETNKGKLYDSDVVDIYVSLVKRADVRYN
jgi:putative nucleotidyltransferase with HDIG domain